jgi:hypothetical protein
MIINLSKNELESVCGSACCQIFVKDWYSCNPLHVKNYNMNKGDKPRCEQIMNLDNNAYAYKYWNEVRCSDVPWKKLQQWNGGEV